MTPAPVESPALREATIRECVNEVCTSCASGRAPEPDDFYGYVHHDDSGGKRYECSAYKLHRVLSLTPSAPTQEGDR